MQYTTIKISEETHKKVKLVSLATGIKQKDFVEQAIQNEINNYIKMLRKLREIEKKQMEL